MCMNDYLVTIRVMLTGGVEFEYPLNGQPIPYSTALTKFQEWALNGVVIEHGPFNAKWYPPSRVNYAVTMPVEPMKGEGDEDVV